MRKNKCSVDCVCDGRTCFRFFFGDAILFFHVSDVHGFVSRAQISLTRFQGKNPMPLLLSISVKAKVPWKGWSTGSYLGL